MIDLTAMGSTNRDLASVMPGGFIKFSGNESTSKIEYNTKLLFTGSSAATLTLSIDSFQGCNVVISNIGSSRVTINSMFSNSSTSYVLNANAILNLTFMNGKWHFDNVISSDGSEQKVHNVNINGTITGSAVDCQTIKSKIATITNINGTSATITNINGTTITGSGTITGNKVVGAVWN